MLVFLSGGSSDSQTVQWVDDGAGNMDVSGERYSLGFGSQTTAFYVGSY
jgi:hypothetical protein